MIKSGDALRSRGAKSERSFPTSGFAGNCCACAGSLRIRAVTEIDSVVGLCIFANGVGLDVNASTLLLIEPDRSRALLTSGDESREIEGGVVFRLRELALSATEGDEFSRTLLAFRIEKNDAVMPGVATAAGGGVAPGAVLDSFSKALILCDIPEPRLTFLATGLDSCWFILLRYAAEAETDLFSSGFEDFENPSNLESLLSFRIGFENVRENRLLF